MATERHYTHSIVSYADIDEIHRLLDQARAWAYIKHDRDDGKATHYHIIATFAQEKSFKWVREQVVSNQNTFTEAVKGEVSDIIDYFTHKGLMDKFQYEQSDIIYSDKTYWERRIGNCETEKEDKNEAFLNDLLATSFSVEEMARKYGRDFIKNFRQYHFFRHHCLYLRRSELAYRMDGIPTEIDEYTGEALSINAVLTKSEYEMIAEIRRNREIKTQQENG